MVLRYYYMNIINKEYKNHWGVYIIRNKMNGDFYIGSTTESFRKRLSRHISAIKNNEKCCAYLYNAVSKYGVENFEIEFIKCFKNKKDSSTNKKIATFLEEKLIERLKPKYNISLKPTKGGCPNLGRKLTTSWKNKIGEKSKLYKHSYNKETHNKMITQNKKGSSIYVIYINEKEEFRGSVVECSKFLGTSTTYFYKFKKENYKIIKEKAQMKQITLLLENENITFKSYGECDKFLNMWRGYTSTQIVNNKNVVLNYKYILK